jgi:SAM-dependent methyltransferase
MSISQKVKFKEFFLLKTVILNSFKSGGIRLFFPLILAWVYFFLDRHKPLSDFSRIEKYFINKNGLEVGGPSILFSDRSALPIYKLARNIDNCNFKNDTVWEDSLLGGINFNYDSTKNGRQFLLEATNLAEIENNTYDFVISSHMLEHTANPIKALKEWKRVLVNGGLMLVVVPHRDGTFDHNRPTTHIAHLIQDFLNDTNEHDLSHLSEDISLHDNRYDMETRNNKDPILMLKDNFKNRCLHHHVFVTDELVKTINYVGLKIVFVRAFLPWHAVICGMKLDELASADQIRWIDKDNLKFLTSNAHWRQLSPFSSDKI